MVWASGPASRVAERPLGSHYWRFRILRPKPLPKAPATRSAVQQFLAVAKAHPPVAKAAPSRRILFALDATASREPTWDLAMNLHTELFQAATGGGTAVQLVYYRGHNEFHVSPWSTTAEALLRRMTGVACRGGLTRIKRVLDHALAEARQAPVAAAVFVGDCCEEPPPLLTAAAGRLALFKLPFFMFQEGHDPAAAQVFGDIARITGGAHAPFDAGGAARLRALFQVVAEYAARGRRGVGALKHEEARAVLAQLPP